MESTKWDSIFSVKLKITELTCCIGVSFIDFDGAHESIPEKNFS